MLLNILKIGVSPASKIRRCLGGQPCNTLKIKREAAKGNHTQNSIAPRRVMVEP